MTQLLKRGKFVWSKEAQTTLDSIKTTMTFAHVLALPDYNQAFVLETDASGVGIGAVLMQNGRLVAFLSKVLTPRHQALSTYEKELLAIVMATQKWHYYLQGSHFIIRTDHQSLKFLLEQRLSTMLQQKWLAKLMGFNYEICYKKGQENVVADALSRIPENYREARITAIVTAQQLWLGEVMDSYMNDSEAQAIITGIAGQDDKYKEFQYSKGVITDNSKVYVGYMEILDRS